MRTLIFLACSLLSAGSALAQSDSYAALPMFVFGEAASWVGAGFAVGDGSCAVTTADLVSETFTSATRYTVRFCTVVSPHTGDYYRAQVINTDPERNLAVLRVLDKGLPGTPLAKAEAYEKVPLIAEKLLLSREDHTARWPAWVYGAMKSRKNPLNVEIREWRAERAVASELRGIKWLYLANVSPQETPPKGSPVFGAADGIVGMYQTRLSVELIGGGKETTLELGQCLPGFEIAPLLAKAGLTDTQVCEGATASGRDKTADDAFQRVYQTLSFVRAGKWREAIESAKALVELRPSNAKAHRLLGVALAGSGAHEDALRELDKAAELDPKVSGLQLDRAETLFALKKDKQAEAAYRAAIEESPLDLRPLLRLSKMLSLDESRRSEAVALARKATAIEPSSPGARMGLGLRLKESGMYDAAVIELKRALSMSPGWSGARLALAETYRAAGKAAEAEEQYRILVEDNPRDPGALLDLAGFLAEMGRKDEARKLLDDLLKLNPPKEMEEAIGKLKTSLSGQ